MRSTALGLVFVLFVAAGCGGDAPEEAWTRIETDGMTAKQVEQRTRGLAAKQALFGRLVSRLGQAMADGPASAVHVCKIAAPDITTNVGEAEGLRIGRTSHRLRNPKNTPPAWAAPYVARKTSSEVWMTHPDGRLAGLLPIPTMGMCLQCHGPWAGITQPVRKALAEHYPDDRAYDFRAGDLRGWFWLEIPPR